MIRCTNKNCLFAQRFMTNGNGLFGLSMFGIAAASYATTMMVFPIGLTLCTLWDDRQVEKRVKRMAKITTELEK